MILETLIVKLDAEIAGFDDALSAADRRVHRFGGQMQDVGQSLTLGVTAPLVAMGAGALKAATDFELAMIGVAKTVDAPQSAIARMGEELKALSETMPLTAAELAGVAEAAGALGVGAADIVEFTKVMADLGVSTNLSANDAAVAIARFANITGTSLSDVDRLGSAIVALGNAGASTEAEITNMALRLAGAGAQIGLSNGEILGFANALSSVGIEAEAGGSAFSKVFIDIAQEVATGGEKLAEFARISGMSVEQFSAAFRDDAGAAIIAFIEGLGAMDSASGETLLALEGLEITEVRMRDALLRASGASDTFAGSLETGNRAIEENNALTAEAEKFYAANASQLKALKNEVVNVAGEFGVALIPAFQFAIEATRGLLDIVRPVVAAFGEMGPATQTVIVAFGGLVAAAGPLIFAVGTIVKLLPALKLGLAVLGGPVTLLAAAAFMSLVAAGAAIIDNWHVIKWETTQLVAKIKEELVGKFGAIVDGVKEKIDAITGFFGGMYDAVVGHSYVPDMIEQIRQQFALLDSVMVAPAQAAAAAVNAAFGGIRAPSIGGGAAVGGGGGGGFFGGLLGNLGLGGGISGILKSVGSGILSSINPIGLLTNLGTSLLGKAASFIGGLFGSDEASPAERRADAWAERLERQQRMAVTKPQIPPEVVAPVVRAAASAMNVPLSWSQNLARHQIASGPMAAGAPLGGVTISGGLNIYQQPGEDGEKLAERVVVGLKRMAAGGDPFARQLVLQPRTAI